MAWSVAQHDTIPSVDLWLNPPDAHTYLFGFLDAAGASFVPPYEAFRTSVRKLIAETTSRSRPRQAPSSDIEDSRVRTWRSVFENFGLIRIDDSKTIQLTPLGRAVKTLYVQINEKIEGANDHLAKLGIEMLARYTLKNPIDPGSYPEDADLKPFRFIWRAMRRLDGKLHWEEMNRAIMHVTYNKDEDAAIDRIRGVRQRLGGNYSTGASALGERAVDDGDQTKRRITPWFTRAGFGGLLITPDDDADGYRFLNPKYVPLIDQALAHEIVTPPEAYSSAPAYLRYLTDLGEVRAAQPSEGDKALIDKARSAVARYGSQRIICFSGLPSTGKSRAGKILANILTGGDPYRYAEIQFHENTSYDDFVEGFVPKQSGDGFELTPKTLLVMNRRAKLDPNGAPYVILIEEFTRGNVLGILGELLTYVEHRERTFRLSLSQVEERIAPNLVFLATMNPRDKSALMLDAAIQRRLHRIELPSSVAALQQMLGGRLPTAVMTSLCDWFGKHMKILPFGHGVFAQVNSVDDLSDVWSGTIIYLLSDAFGEIREQYKQAAEDYPWKPTEAAS
jgi:hypothetical protein